VKERFGGIGKLGKELKGAVNKAPKSKGSSGAKNKDKKGSGSGADKGKRVAREVLK
jgi:type IV secretory pathway TrbL component